jgi:hypothetical protein
MNGRFGWTYLKVAGNIFQVEIDPSSWLEDRIRVPPPPAASIISTISRPRHTRTATMAKPVAIVSSKYSWYPPNRPPSADPSIAMRVAVMGPLGKCLETALEELLVEDQQDNRNPIGEKITGLRGRNVPCTTREEQSRHHKTYENSEHNGTNGQLHQERDNDSESSSTPTRRDHDIAFDEAMSKSILDAYCKAVVETKFDDGTNPSNTVATAPTPLQATTKAIQDDTTRAPAAMLMGEIDHYNRVGGQWRIVVKNACLKRRSMTQIDNGKTGRSLRKRTVLDWNDNIGVDDDDIDNDARNAINDTGGMPRKKGSSNSLDVHHFPGTIQILAYDDDT